MNKKGELESSMLNKLIVQAKEKTVKPTIIITHATHPSVFEAAKHALEEKLASFIFIGPMEQMKKIGDELNYGKHIDHYSFVHAESELEAAEKSVSLVNEGKGNVLMKGMVATPILLKAVLNKENGLRTGRILSHLAGFSIPTKEKILYITDCAMNISPNLEEKKEIVQNAVDAVVNVGVPVPKVAVLAAIENVNPAMVATIDAAVLTQMNRRKQITNCIVDGPLAFDIALSKEAAAQKGIQSDVAGDADILLVPTIEVGNAVYKSLTLFGDALVGSVILGAKVPIVLTSRADSAKSKLFSMAMAINMSYANEI